MQSIHVQYCRTDTDQNSNLVSICSGWIRSEHLIIRYVRFMRTIIVQERHLWLTKPVCECYKYDYASFFSVGPQNGRSFTNITISLWFLIDMQSTVLAWANVTRENRQNMQLSTICKQRNSQYKQDYTLCFSVKILSQIIRSLYGFNRLSSLGPVI